MVMPLWLSDTLVVIALLVASEMMFRVGRKIRGPVDDAVRSQVSTAQASILGLLALMLGFTLAMAEGRFNARRVYVIEEAAAVGTTYLRAEYLPQPWGQQSRAMLRDYVQSRRAYYRASADEAPAATARSQAIQARLWAEVVARAPQYLDADLVGLYVDSLNRMIDLEGMRDISIQSRLPWTIRVLLLMVALGAVGVSGYASGLGGRRRIALSLWLIPALIGLAYCVIADLDRSRAGRITTGDLPMMRLERSMQAEQTSAQRQ